MTHEKTPSASGGKSWRKTLVQFFLFALALYAALVALSAAVFYTPWSMLKSMYDPKRDQLISMGVFTPTHHPLYREWLHHFVRTPDEPRGSQYFMDTYYAYGVMLEGAIDEYDSDFLGFPNAISPHDAKVVFVGDSFCVGASAGSKRAPAAIYARLTGTPTYNGSNGGYGMAQYLAILKKITRDLPEDKRFAGRDVVLMSYLGNDFTSDIVQHERRIMHTDKAPLWLMELGPLRAWVKYLRITYGQAHAAPVIPQGIYAPIPMKCETSGMMPFVWHPGYSSMLDPENISGPMPAARETVRQIKELEKSGLRIHVVLIPANIQVVYDDIDWSKIPRDSRLAKDTPKIYEAMKVVRQNAVDTFKSFGFDVLDLTDVMRDNPQHCMLYQPGDTHCTPLGFEVIGKAIADKWPDLGR